MITFVHSLFRSGSTYVFDVLRRCNPGHTCFQEAFHEGAATYKDNPTGLIEDRVAEADTLFRHPKLDAPYCAELVKAWPSWRNKLVEDDLFLNYFGFSGRGTGIGFWQSIVDSTPGPVIFQECRTTGKLKELRGDFKGSFHIYLLRNPWDQWFSYKVHPYFDATVRAIHASQTRPAACLGLLASLSMETDHLQQSLSASEQLYFYIQNPLPPSKSYSLFFMIWCLGLLEAFRSADLIIEMDSLNESSIYRKSIVEHLADNGISANFDNVDLFRTPYIFGDANYFKPLEGHVHECLLNGGYTEAEIAKVKDFQERNTQLIDMAPSPTLSGKDFESVLHSSSRARLSYISQAENDFSFRNSHFAKLESLAQGKLESAQKDRDALVNQLSELRSNYQDALDAIGSVQKENDSLRARIPILEQRLLENQSKDSEIKALRVRLSLLEREAGLYYQDISRLMAKLNWWRNQGEVLKGMLKTRASTAARLSFVSSRLLGKNR
ncbi:MAG: hypothetical protein VKK63_00085 [Synechococcus sp.]|nr:hypothetical protein [Synechococcus sp.]